MRRALLWLVLVTDNGQLDAIVLQQECLSVMLLWFNRHCVTTLPCAHKPVSIQKDPSSERNCLISVLNIRNYFKLNANKILFLDSS
jgi:hypothetical protein